jgi:TonB family protein
MQGYSGFKKKKSALGSTLMIVAALHLVAAGGVIWLASTQTGRQILAVYKINVLNLPLPKPEPPPEAPKMKPPEPEPPPPQEEAPAEKAPEPAPEMEAEAPPPEAPMPAEMAAVESPTSDAAMVEEPVDSGPLPTVTEIPNGPVRLPGSGNPFAGGKGGKRFSGYTDIVTSEIQKYYKQPTDLPGDLRLAVLLQLRLDEEGRLIEYKLMRSSGNPLFDESAIRALSNIKQLRRPPQGMSKTLTVKFFPPTG